MSVRSRLRELAASLPEGASLVLTREALLALAAEVEPDSTATVHTVASLASALHRSPSTVRGWCEAGRFEGAFKLNGRDWRVPSAALEAFLAGQQPAAPRVDPQRVQSSSPADITAWRRVKRTAQ